MSFNIQMVDLKRQYERIKEEMDRAILGCISSTKFIKGPYVEEFEEAFKAYLGAEFVISCGNGTDALQIALMALELQPKDEIIIPAFTYVATAEVIGLLGLTPVLVDVDPNNFNIDINLIEKAITSRTKAIVPVHLFGQGANMEALLEVAKRSNLFIVEDNAQAIGADYFFKDGSSKKLGTIGTIGCTSFFPSKNLGCYGDGGALVTNNHELAAKIRMIANHGQPKQYTHDVIGVNSRLDALQAAILSCKLPHLDEYNKSRRDAADLYNVGLESVKGISIPSRDYYSNHVYHQYTIKVKGDKRDQLKKHLQDNSIPSMIYYPKPLHYQKAYEEIVFIPDTLSVSEQLTAEVLSLPIHTELSSDEQNYIISTIHKFFL